MELKYGFMVPLGVAVIVVLAVLFIAAGRRRKKYSGGVKAANFDLLTEDTYYRRQLYIYRGLRLLLVGALLSAVMASFVFFARPYHIRKTKEKMYSRDIIFCLDVSTSVNDLNMKLTKELQNTVRRLNGERIGIVIFNTSPILLVPLTDDYDYVIEQLENIRTAIRVTDSSNVTKYQEDWFYWYSFLMGGTLVGNEERGSSLISEGLLGAVFNFPDSDKQRTRIVILSTDNELNGTPMVTLSEAAEICERNHVVVYGIGTKNMLQAPKEEMKSSVETTGGKFYLEESASTFNLIVDDIESHSADLIEGKTYIKEIEDPQRSFMMLVYCFALMVVLSVLLRRADLWWGLRCIVTAGLLLGVFYMVVIPSRYSDSGTGPNYRADSDLNVLFVVDDTISMLARDHDGGTERLTAVKEDCGRIIDELYGARFSVIAFDNEAKVLAPFTNNGEHIKNVIASVYPPEEFYAKGTSINAVKSAALGILKKAADDGREKTAVFFISDGEITTEASLESFHELAPYIDGGAVLGYGTKQGGEMFIRDPYEEGEEKQIMDTRNWPFEPARSYIDEKNLKRIAGDMKIEYVNMNDGNLMPVLQAMKSRMNTVITEVEQDGGGNEVYEKAKDNPWYYLMLPVVGLLFLEAALLMRRKG